MSSAFILQQAQAFGPGRVTGILRDFGIPVQIRKLFAGDEVPSDLDEIRFVVALGGPMRIADGAGAEAAFLANETELLKRMIAIDRPILGIGLGAQLLARAAGAKVHANPTPEWGWLPVTFPFPGGTEPMVTGMTDGAPMFHWHADTFDLPRLPGPATPPPPGTPPPPSGNSLLSSSKACKNQAFRFKNRLFGFQFHFELTAADIDAIVAAHAAEAPALLSADKMKEIRDQTEKNLGRYTRLGDRILRNFVQFTKTY
jgi:GMP synthase-like glutamine amidotransferase